ncbi:MAG: hypothetical protein H6745_04815 [Deltaproteobacteria bacterium]|nr:hypothetical protein [Deltaproteobacteria bacterium]
MATDTSTVSPAVQRRSEESPSSTSSSSGGGSEGGRYATPGVSRDFLAGASYDAAASSLAPDGGAGLKYERSLTPAPVQMEKTEGSTPPAAPPGPPPVPAGIGQTVVPGAPPPTVLGRPTYDVEGKGAYGYEKHTEDAKDGSYKKGDYKTDASGNKVLGGTYGNVVGTGVGFGDRKADTKQLKDAKDPSKGYEDAKSKKVSLSDITGIPEPDLKKIPSLAKAEVTGAYGTYAGYDVKAGSASEVKSGWDVGLDLKKTETSKLSLEKLAKLEGPSAQGAIGARADAYAGIKGKTEGAYGSAEAGAKANAYGYIGASGKAGINQDGASASGAAGLGIGVGVSADADVKSAGLKVDGVTDPLTVGAGVHGEANAWAKAGVGGGAYLTKDKVGLVGQAGIGAVAEAKADIHGHVGPVSGTYGVGVLAGAGAGIEGGILWEDGKLVIGARAYAALGYGVSTGGKIVIDLKQSYELGAALLKKARDIGIEGAKRAYAAADADNDGKLSLNDAATHGANAMKSGAETVAGGIRGGIKMLDGDGDGKFDLRKDMGAHLDAAGKAVSEAGKSAYKRGEELVDGAVKMGKEMLKSAHDAVDVDGDGKLSLADAGAAYDKAVKAVDASIDAATKRAGQAYDDAMAWGKDRLDDVKKAAEAAHKMADRSGDGKLGIDDAVIAGKELAAAGGKMVDRGYNAAKDAYKAGSEMVGAGVKRAGEMYDAGAKRAGEMYDSGKKAVGAAIDSAHKTLDRDGDGKLGIGDAIAGAQQAGTAIQETAKAAQKTIEEGYDRAVKAADAARKAVFDAADVNKDGKVDAADAKMAAQQAAAAAERARQRAAAWAAEQKRRASAALEAARKQASEIAKTAHKALDRTGDGKLGMDDVRAGASEAYAAAQKQYQSTRKQVVETATAAYKSAREGISTAATTLSNGYTSARETVGSAMNDAREFFGEPPW